MIIAAGFVSCSKDEEIATPSSPIEGVQLRDINAQAIGVVGNHWEDDWKNDSKLNRHEMELLNFEDGLSLEGTSSEGFISGSSVLAYPIPAKDYFTILMTSDKPVKFKVVIVDENLKVLDRKSVVGYRLAYQFDKFIKRQEVQTAGILQGSGGMFDFSDNSTFPESSIVRAYYSMSAEENEHFATGYGDILICRSSLEDCGVEL